ncbi:MAG: hypothetical protein RX318_03280 [bacterium]|nr:hypothetical protein [bacterium]
MDRSKDKKAFAVRGDYPRKAGLSQIRTLPAPARTYQGEALEISSFWVVGMAWFKKKITSHQMGNILASVAVERSGFLFDELQGLYGLTELPEEQKFNLKLEVDVFVLFSVVAGVQFAISDKTIQETILDQMHESVYELYAETLGMNNTELDKLEKLIQNRYASYFHVLQEYEGGDSMFRLGKQFVDNALGGDKSLLEIMAYIPGQYVIISKNTKELVEKYRVR